MTLLRALVDVRFRYRVAPVLVRWVYVAALAAVGGGMVFGVLLMWSLAAWLGWPFWVLMVALVAGAVGTLLGVRIALELALARVVPPPAPSARPGPSGPPPPSFGRPAAPPAPPVPPGPAGMRRPPWP